MIFVGRERNSIGLIPRRINSAYGWKCVCELKGNYRCRLPRDSLSTIFSTGSRNIVAPSGMRQVGIRGLTRYNL